MIQIILFVFFLSNFLNAQDNMLPLEKGNKYQYIKNTTAANGYWYSLITNFISNDTIINNKKYYSSYNSNDFYRYNIDSNKAYLNYNGIEGVYCDFNISHDSLFIQFSPLTHSFGQVYAISSIGKVFDTTCTIKGYRTPPFGGSRSEIFRENIGKISLTQSSYDGPGIWNEVTISLINAIIYDSLGNYKYYSKNHRPIITFQPFLSVGDSIFCSFSVEVNHYYNLYSKFYGTYKEGVNYIDTVFMEYYYEKDSLKTIEQISYATRIPVSNSYNFSIQLDNSLLKKYFRMVYRIGTRDKSIIPVYSYSPDSGYYQAVYQPTSIENESLQEKTFSLSQNYPNPFNPSTKVKYTIGSPQYAILKVYDVLGKEVAILVNEYKPDGTYEVEFSTVGTLHATSLPSGVYFYQLKAGDFVQTKKMILLR